jgi:lipoate-protein ligase A
MVQLRSAVESFRDDVDRIAPRARALVRTSVREKRAILHAYTLDGDVLSIGQFHVVPEAPGLPLVRRLAGGRAAPLGAGYLGVMLALPHRSALVADDPAALAPDQVLNRAVRGLLGALETFGVRGHYPGRDVVTARGRTLASLAFEVDDDGGTLVEMTIALRRSFAELTGFADRADPAGVVPIELLLPDAATSVAEERGDAPDAATFTTAIARALGERLGVVVHDEPEPLPAVAPDPTWLDAGRVRDLPRHATRRAMLGVVQAFVACNDGRVGDVRLRGDFIAPSATIARIEAALRGAPIEPTALRARVRDAVSAADFVLGVPGFDTFAELVHEAAS